MEDLGLEDEDSIGTLAWDQIMRIWRIDNLPSLDAELETFLKYIAMRHSKNLGEVAYSEWCQVFAEDYQIEATPHDDRQAFNHYQAKDDQADVVVS